VVLSAIISAETPSCWTSCFTAAWPAVGVLWVSATSIATRWPLIPPLLFTHLAQACATGTAGAKVACSTPVCATAKPILMGVPVGADAELDGALCTLLRPLELVPFVVLPFELQAPATTGSTSAAATSNWRLPGLRMRQGSFLGRTRVVPVAEPV
jgi:hypothetical protein